MYIEHKYTIGNVGNTAEEVGAHAFSLNETELMEIRVGEKWGPISSYARHPTRLFPDRNLWHVHNTSASCRYNSHIILLYKLLLI